jgi:PAS domain S-box-containing protein
MHDPSSQDSLAPATRPDGHAVHRFIGEGSVMRDLVRAFDWAATPLGPIADWPSSLKTVVSIVLNSSHPMFLWWGQQLTQIYNDAYLPSFGAGKHPAALGQRGIDCWEEIWPIIWPQIDSVMSGGASTWYENALVPIGRNGIVEAVYWSYTYTPVFDERDAIAGVLVVCTETTSGILAERRRKILTELTGRMVGCSSEPAVMEVIDEVARNHPADIRRIWGNDALDGLGGTTAEVSSAQPSGARDEAKDQAAGGNTNRTAENGQIITLPIPGIARDDLTLTFELGLQLPYDDAYRHFLEEFSAYVGVALRQVQHAREKEIAAADRDRLLMDAPVGAGVLIGNDLVFQVANRAYCEIVGRDDLIGKSFAEVFPELADSDTHNIFRNVYLTGKPYVTPEKHVRLRMSGGKELQDHFYSFNLAPLRSTVGGVYGIMFIAVDITQQVEVRREIERLNVDLRVAAQAKDEFLAMLGHELRNPLAPIVTALQLMKLRSAETSREQVIIQRQVDHLVRLVDDLLDVSKITRGKVVLRPEWVEVREVLGKAVEMADYLLEQKRHRLGVDAPQALWYGDPARLAQVIANLLTNAARYTPEGGNIELSAHVRDDELEIQVKDNGVGISPNLLPSVFDLFVQGGRSPDRAEGGLGIGLSLVKNLVGMHGGHVRAASAGEGKGSTFTIRVPCKPKASTVDESPMQSRLVADSIQKRVLVVDDNQDAAESLAEVLRMLGHPVTLAYDPLQALAVAARAIPDVAILDIGLPGMDGYELAVRLRELDREGRCRFIALSGYGQDQDRQRSAQAGFSVHMIKPVDIAALSQLIRDDGTSQSAT